MKNDEINITFHEIQNIVSIVGCTLETMEKNNPMLSQIEYWDETRSDMEYLKSLVIRAYNQLNGNS